MKKFALQATAPAMMMMLGTFMAVASPATAFAQEQESITFTYNGITYERVTRVNHRGFWHEGGTIYEEFSDIAYVPGPPPLPSLASFLAQLEAAGIPVVRN